MNEDKSKLIDVFSDEPYKNFEQPPLCPIFTPTEDEFADAITYIEKIKPLVEPYGICKIKPPPDWQPPFAINVDTFKFVPRVQRINELEAKIRTKMTYLNRLTRYWHLQGVTLKVPYVDGRFLDLFMLQRNVEKEGGYDNVCQAKLWTKISHIMNYPQNKNIGHILKNNYEKIILPFVIFKSGVAFDPVKLQQKQKGEDGTENGSMTEDKDSATRKSRRYLKEEPVIDYSANSELKKLQFYGAGPKAAVPTVPYPVAGEFENSEISEDDANAKTRLKQGILSKVDTYMCYMCSKGDQEDCMLLCDDCDASYHTFCLIPPLPNIPRGDWRCPTCLELECSKPVDPYGFAQSKKEYNLQTFGEIADQFKSDYFNMPVHMVTIEQVEKEYWRLLNTLDEDISVLYGADIHAMEVGSGFPREDTKDVHPDDMEYVTSTWNLNNLSVGDKSILKHINADVSGMKIPWCYVGMCFSTFCWHTEDHWTSSINYLHWGEPKTWYAAPRTSATALEDVMKKAAPELFIDSPDLMHQLTTTMNPYMLRQHGVPIVKANQCAGEFIVTMPRAYHSGFNHGYNFAEAVNFATADWMAVGLDCIYHYRQLKRQCVFSHEELVCKMAADPDALDLNLAAFTHSDMLAMVSSERKLRKSLHDKGVKNAEREAFELLPDDERQCGNCQTTCFLSAVTCSCSSERIVCIHCMDKLCQCDFSNYVLRYRYTLDELPIMLQRLKTRAESYNTWVAKVTRALTADQSDKVDFYELREFVTEADDKQYPDSDLLDAVSTAINEAEKCANVASQLLSKKSRATRNRQSGDTKYVCKLSLEEVCLFYEQVRGLVCVIPESHQLKELVDRVLDFQSKAQKTLTDEEPNSENLDSLINIGISLDVDLPEIPRLKEVLQQAKWLDGVHDIMADHANFTLDKMRTLLESGVSLSPHPSVERVIAELQELLILSERWEEKARICLLAKPSHMVTTLEAIINESKSIPAYLPNVSSLHEAMRKAKEWCAKVEAIQLSDTYPYVETLESLLLKGRSIPVRLDQLPQVDSQVAAAKSWRERTARTFLKKNSTHTLLDVLLPRKDISSSPTKTKRKKRDSDSKDSQPVEITFDETTDPSVMVSAFKAAEKQEIDQITELRLRNIEKYHAAMESYEELKFCTCRKGVSGFMLQCELCKDCFHSSCVPLPKSTGLKSKPPASGSIQLARDFKFLCPQCQQSRRPRLETILSLLVSLQKLPVRLQEGEALQCLTERAMAWQDRARQSLATPELANALTKLSILSQKMVEQAARAKTEKIINAELMKAASNPDLQEHLASVTQSAFKGIHQPEVVKPEWPAVDAMTDASTDPKSPVDETELISVCSDEKDPTTGMPTEHTYSSVSKNSLLSPTRKQSRKQTLVPHQDAPLLELSSMAKAQLEALMMEGDLLEVSLDETQHLWRILQACKSTNEAHFFDSQPMDADVKPTFSSLSKNLFMKKKKKRALKDTTDLLKVKRIKKEPREKMVTENKPIIEEEVPKKNLKVKVKEKEHKVKVMPKEKIKAIPEPVKEKAVLDDPFSDKLIIDESLEIKKKKKFKVKLEPVKLEKKRHKKVKKTESKMNANDINNDDCSANKCLRPLGEEVNWVQCDACELWFHLLCVGIGDNELKDDEEYICAMCQPEDLNKSDSKLVIKTENKYDDDLYEGTSDEAKSRQSSLDAMKSLLTKIDVSDKIEKDDLLENYEGFHLSSEESSRDNSKKGASEVEKLSSIVSAIDATGLGLLAETSGLLEHGVDINEWKAFGQKFGSGISEISEESEVDKESRDTSEWIDKEQKIVERKMSEELDVVDVTELDDIQDWKINLAQRESDTEKNCESSADADSYGNHKDNDGDEEDFNDDNDDNDNMDDDLDLTAKEVIDLDDDSEADIINSADDNVENDNMLGETDNNIYSLSDSEDDIEVSEGEEVKLFETESQSVEADSRSDKISPERESILEKIEIEFSNSHDEEKSTLISDVGSQINADVNDTINESVADITDNTEIENSTDPAPLLMSQDDCCETEMSEKTVNEDINNDIINNFASSEEQEQSFNDQETSSDILMVDQERNSYVSMVDHASTTQNTNILANNPPDYCE